MLRFARCAARLSGHAPPALSFAAALPTLSCARQVLSTNTAATELALPAARGELTADQEKELGERLQAMEAKAMEPQTEAQRNQAVGAQVSEELLRAGLFVEDVVQGEGPAAELGQWVSIQVHGELQDGTVFEDSSASGKSLSFQLGSGQVILGMDGGVAGMRVGGTRVLNVPPHLGYGFKRVGDIPPNSDLTFTVKLVGVGEQAEPKSRPWYAGLLEVFQ